MPKPKVLITDPVWRDNAIEKRVLDEVPADFTLAPSGDEATLVGMVGEYDAIITNFGQITRKVLNAATRALIVARYGIGYDNVDVQAATDNGILLTNVPGFCADEQAEHVLGLLLDCARKISLLDRSVKQGGWDRKIAVPVSRVWGQTLGIIGWGNSARAVARRAPGLGLKVLVYTRHPNAEELAKYGATAVDKATLLGQSDFVSLNLTANSETYHYMSEAEFRAMKPRAFIINVGRGALIDEKALYRALTEGWIAGAGLDVLEQEPPATDNPIPKLDNVVITPHSAFYSEDSVAVLQESAAREVVRVLKGEPPKAPVNAEVLDARGRVKKALGRA